MSEEEKAVVAKYPLATVFATTFGTMQKFRICDNRHGSRRVYSGWKVSEREAWADALARINSGIEPQRPVRKRD